jgi:SpoVK/Ycf46/Vps4 family AAA+-type ATPase
MDYLDQIKAHITALTPLLYVGTCSPDAIREELKQMASCMEMDFYCASLTDVTTKGEDPLQVLDKMIASNSKQPSQGRCLWVLYLYHLLLKDADPLLITKLRQLADSTTLNRTVIIIGIPYFRLPPELADVLQINHAMLSSRELRDLIMSSGGSYTEQDLTALITSLTGIKSRNEAETFLALSMVKKGGRSFDAGFILQEKKRLAQTRSNGLFEIVEPEYGLDYIGGMDRLMDWISLRMPLLTMESWKYPRLSRPRGILLIGVPGGGKSFFAAAVGKSHDLPVIKLNPSRLFQSSLGETEGNFLEVLECVQSFHSPVIFFIDEIEKSFSRTDGATDGNTSNRILALLLDFLSNHTQPVFTIATCNSIGALPPELLRKGRFDEVFYIPFPGHEERRGICAALAKKYGIDIPLTDFFIKRLEGFTGSEIEQVFKDALYEALGRNMNTVGELNLLKQAESIVPIKLTMGEELDSLERWARGKCRWATDKPGRSCRETHDRI